MRWHDGHCKLSDTIYADIYGAFGVWKAAIYCSEGDTLWADYELGSEAAAKSAVAAWIGKTMAQLSNALAAGEPRIDEE